MSTNYNEPNRFCGECAVYLNIGEPGISPEQNEQLLRECKACSAWRLNGVQLMNINNVGQCWECKNRISKEMINPVEGEKVYVPFCSLKERFIKELPDTVCKDFKPTDHSVLRCSNCDHSFERFEHFVEYENKPYCENCFFDIALEKLGAKSMQMDSNCNPMEPEAEDIDEDDQISFADLYEDFWR